MKDLIKNPIFWYVIGGIIALIIIRKLLINIGIIKSETSLKNDAKISKPANYFNSEYFNKSKNRGTILKDSVLKDMTKTIYNSFHGSTASRIFTFGMATLGTNENVFFGTLSQLKSKMQVSQLVDYYYKLYKVDFLSDVNAELNESELVKFFNYIESLPNIY